LLIQVINSASEAPSPANPQFAAADAVAMGADLSGASAPPTTPSVLHAGLSSVCNPASPIPLYSQIRERLRACILDGTYLSNGKLPSENEMVKTFEVSRITVRQALNDLQKEGLIFKIHGKGTFVARPKVVQKLVRVEGFGEAMLGAGRETFSLVLGTRLIRAGASISARLQLAEGTQVMEIRRQRFLDRNPISLDVTYVPAAIGTRLIKEDLAHRDVFEILDNDYGFALECAELKIDAIKADASLAQILAIEEGAAVMRIERLTFTSHERPIDFEHLYHPGNAFQYHVRVGRRRDAAAVRRTNELTNGTSK